MWNAREPLNHSYLKTKGISQAQFSFQLLPTIAVKRQISVFHNKLKSCTVDVP